jgi:hypothetical protein
MFRRKWRSMRIGMLSHNYGPHPGGVEVVIQNLGRRLPRQLQIVLVTSAYEGRSGVSQEDGIEVHRLPALHVTERMGRRTRSRSVEVSLHLRPAGR